MVAAQAAGIAVDALGPHVALPPRPPALLLGYTRLGEAALARAGHLLRRSLQDCHNRSESSG